jgi:hypothetical protein
MDGNITHTDYVKQGYEKIYQTRATALASFDASYKFWRTRLEETLTSRDPEAGYTESGSGEEFGFFARWMTRAAQTLHTAMTRCDQQETELNVIAGDPLVLLRQTQGLPLRRYHFQDAPCGLVTGRGRSLSNFKPMLEGEVRARYRWLTRCRACTWPPSTNAH